MDTSSEFSFAIALVTSLLAIAVSSQDFSGLELVGAAVLAVVAGGNLFSGLVSLRKN